MMRWLLPIALLSFVAAAGEDPRWKPLVEKAVQQAQEGNLDEAINSANEALAIKETFTPHQLLSQIYLAKSDHQKSLEHMEKAYALEPASEALNAGVHFHRSIMQQGKGNYKQAMQLLKKSVDLEPEVDIKNLEKVAIAAAALGDITYCVEVLRKLWALAPAYVFHNSLSFVRIADKYEEFVKLAREEGGEDGAKAAQVELSNVTTITQSIYFDLTIGGADAGRVTIGLYGLAAPKAVKNLVQMSKCQKQKYCYKGSAFHRVIKDFVLQGGDVAKGDGTGVVNIYDRPFADEVFALTLMHDKEGIFQLANAGPDSNGGQFVIMCGQAPHLNGAHMVIGKVLEGLDVVRKANSVKVDAAHKPEEGQTVEIKDCGAL